ncbi:MAG: hypothetical protein J5943_00875 [Oribacterium sp.]|nr:hypothetical protein [Oribacterium sp.]MBO6310766.1 hypothetical protein [Oribacterium sp.]MBP3806224.1 hypothetical protein [Oribacterium sp.]
MKQSLSIDMFKTFANNLPIIESCSVDANNVATLILSNNDETSFQLAISRDGYPKQIKTVISEMVSDLYCVILAPYITEQTAELCKRAGYGFLDLAGNCYIAYKTLFVEIKGNKNENTPKRSIKSIYERSSVVSSVILRTILEDTRRRWKLQDLASAAGCSIGQVSKVKEFLLNQTYIEQSKDGISVTDPKSIMRDWARVYSDYTEEKVQCYSLSGITDIEAKIAKMTKETGIKCILTGFSGGVRYQPVVRYQKIHALIDANDLDKIVEYLGLKRVDSGANVILIIKYDSCVGVKSRIIKNNLVASPVQVFLDCMSLKGRGEEMAEEILSKEICR